MSPEELASKELAAWRQRENRHVRLVNSCCLFDSLSICNFCLQVRCMQKEQNGCCNQAGGSLINLVPKDVVRTEVKGV